MKKQFFLVLVALCGFAACNNKDENTKAESSIEIYEEYKISAEEGKEAVTIRAQFRREGKTGSSIFLKDQSKLLFDGEPLAADSVGKIGWFYEVQKRLDEFEGGHNFVFIDEDGTREERPFDFQLFTLDSFPLSVSRKQLILNLPGLENNSPVHLILTDTAFISNDINTIDTVKKGVLVIKQESLSNLENGPVNLQIIFKQTKNIQKRGAAAGRLTATYSIRRSFNLKD